MGKSKAFKWRNNIIKKVPAVGGIWIGTIMLKLVRRVRKHQGNMEEPGGRSEEEGGKDKFS